MILAEYLDLFIANLLYAVGIKTFKYKLAYTAMATIIISPIVWVSDFVRSFLIPERYFFQTIVFLCLCDAIIGILKSLKLKNFNPLLLVIGFATKIGVSYIVLQVFQSISQQPEFLHTPEMKNYFTLSWKLMLMFYPCISFFNNIYYVSNKKFPPKWWMVRQHNFEEDGNVNNLLGKNDNNEPINNVTNEQTNFN